jgi:hypothetical protein
MRDTVLNSLAKLLATENIDIQYTQKSSGAWFDINNRVLALPKLSNICEERYVMFLFHEVSHAIYTPKEFSEIIKADYRMKHFLNAVEDARIERLIKKKYPGIRSDFARGYAKCVEADVFAMNGKSTENLSLIDRLNLRAKVGSMYDIKFSKSELGFAEEFNTIETWDQAVDLARRLKAHADELRSRETKKNDLTPIDLTSNRRVTTPSDSLDDNDDTDTVDDNDDANEVNLNELLEPFTQDKLDSDIKKHAHANAYAHESDSVKIDYAAFDYRDYVISTDLHIEALKELHASEKANGNPEFSNYCANAMVAFNAKNRSMITYMLKEYETKKAASTYSRAREAKTGVLSTKALHRYKFSEDIFRRVTVIPEGKSHGLVMFVDFSSSMSNIIGETIEQVLLLASFCRRAGIRHRVFSFTLRNLKTIAETNNPYIPTAWANRAPSREVSFIHQSTHLIELLNDRMKTSDFNFVAGSLLRCVGGYGNPYARLYSMSSTPLNDTIILARQIIREFKKTTGAECVSAVFLTDGDSDSPNFDYRRAIDGDTRMPLETDVEVSRYVRRDFTEVLVKTLRRVLGIEVINFHIINRGDWMYRTLRKSLDKAAANRLSHAGAVTLREKDGFSAQHITVGSNLSVDDDWDRDLDAAASTRTLAKAFLKGSQKKKNTRPILSDFVARISRAI